MAEHGKAVLSAFVPGWGLLCGTAGCVLGARAAEVGWVSRQVSEFIAVPHISVLTLSQRLIIFKG